MNKANGNLYVYTGDGGGQFTSAIRAGTGADGWGSYELGAGGDFNSDGRADFVALNKANGNLYVYTGDGGGQFTSAILAGTGADGWGSYELGAGGDFNSDGRADFVALNKANGNLYVYTGNGGGQFTSAILAGTGADGWGTYELGAGGDFNSDGRADFVALNKANGNLYVYTGNGAGQFTSAILAGTGADGWGTYDLGAGGDFNRDGRADFVALNKANGNLYVYTGNGAGQFTSAILAGTGANGWDTYSLGTGGGDFAGPPPGNQSPDGTDLSEFPPLMKPELGSNGVIQASTCSAELSWVGGNYADEAVKVYAPRGSVRQCVTRYKLRDNDPYSKYFYVYAEAEYTVKREYAAYRDTPSVGYINIKSSVPANGVFDASDSVVSHRGCNEDLGLSLSAGPLSFPLPVPALACPDFGFERTSRTDTGATFKAPRVGGVRRFGVGYFIKVKESESPVFTVDIFRPNYTYTWNGTRWVQKTAHTKSTYVQ